MSGVVQFVDPDIGSFLTEVQVRLPPLPEPIPQRNQWAPQDFSQRQ